MAYVNVAEWKPDQVTEWLKGLDSSILPYLQLFLTNKVSGQQLLNVRSEDLDNLGVKRLGHQELILEAVEQLRNFHYELDRENLQLLALRLSCQAHSLHNELLQHTDSQPVSTQTLADVASVVRAVKPLVCWLDRSPFTGQLEYADRKSDLLKYSLEIATCAQRDRFAERPVEEIRTSCQKLAVIADGIIQDIADPLILQPASLDLATLRKRGSDDLGFYILPSFYGVHQIGEIKFGSPAHQCGKVEEGDEVVQVNYQTVVGWQRMKVVALFEESLTDVFLTLKKRPRHTKVYGQIYMKPYRLPSKKRAPAYTRWHDNLPSPRPELLTIPDFELPPPRSAPKTPPAKHITLEPLNSTVISTSSESDDVGSGCDETSLDYELEGHTSPTSMRLYLPKPRVPVQRRATITGASPTSHLPPVDLEKFLRELKLDKKWKFSGKTPESHNSNPECRLLRSKSPCEQNERPSTCLGFEKSSSREYIKRVDYIVNSGKGTDSKNALAASGNEESVPGLTECSPDQNRKLIFVNSSDDSQQTSPSHCMNPKGEKRYITRLELIVDPHDSCIEFTEVNSENPGSRKPFVEKLPSSPRSPFFEDGAEVPVEKNRKISTESQVGELPIHRERGRLDKSFSTPAYDLSGLEGLGMNSSGKNSPAEKSEIESFGKPSPSLELSGQQSPMPDLTTSAAGMKRAKDHSSPTIFQFPAPNSNKSFLSSHTVSETVHHNTPQESYDLNFNPILHGRVVETINRHLLNSNCGKDYLDDCSDLCDITSANTGLQRTVLNSPDIISDIKTQRFYPKPSDDFENGNHITLKESHELDNLGSNLDTNSNSDQLSLKQNTAIDDKGLPANRHGHHNEDSTETSPRGGSEDAKKPSPTPPVRHQVSVENTEKSSIALSQHPKIPSKITVTPPEPPPRPSHPNRSPLVPSEQHKASLRSIISNKTGNQKSVFGSPKVSREKNPLLAKRRSISVKELGVADYQGWLYRRVRIGDSGAQWIKGWFILKGTMFYGFKGREAHKADFFINLPGFTTSLAEEVKSRKFAFKVYHTGTVFYFAAESEEELAAWMDCLSTATHVLDLITSKASALEGAVFSETEDEGDEPEVTDSCFPSPKMLKFTNFLSGHLSHPTQATSSSSSPKPARSHQNLATSCESKTYDIQKKFGSLKKLGYRSKFTNQLSPQSSSSATSLSGSEQSQDGVSAPHSLDRKYLRFLSSSKTQNVPVPTAQFRSYRRVAATEHCPPPFTGNSKTSDGGSCGSSKMDGTGNETNSISGDRLLHPNLRNVINSFGDSEIRRNNRGQDQRGDDTAGLLTLEQFMLQRQEEERHQNQLSMASQHQERHNREQERDAAVSSHRDVNEGYTEDPVLSLHKSLEKRRTPPPAPHPPSPSTHQQPAMKPIPAARTILPIQSSAEGGSSDPPAIMPRTYRLAGDSRNYRDFSSGTVNHSPDTLPETPRRSIPSVPKQPQLKNAAMYQPPPVVLTPSSHLGPSFEMHLDHRSTVAAPLDDTLEGARSKASNLKLRQFLSLKRGHQHGPVTPSNRLEASTPNTQRTILGSPRLHRALFRQSDNRKQRNVSQSDSSDSSFYSPTNFGSAVPFASSSISPDWSSDHAPALSPKPTMGVAMLGKKPAPVISSFSNINSLAAMSPPLSPPQTPLSPPPDYPGLEYPPVFEPGIYSLSDSSTLLSPSCSLHSPSSDTSCSQPSQR